VVEVRLLVVLALQLEVHHEEYVARVDHLLDCLNAIVVVPGCRPESEVHNIVPYIMRRDVVNPGIRAFRESRKAVKCSSRVEQEKRD
jgi:hypothetical protein